MWPMHRRCRGAHAKRSIDSSIMNKDNLDKSITPSLNTDKTIESTDNSMFRSHQVSISHNLYSKSTSEFCFFLKVLQLIKVSRAGTENYTLGFIVIKLSISIKFPQDFV